MIPFKKKSERRRRRRGRGEGKRDLILWPALGVEIGEHEALFLLEIIQIVFCEQEAVVGDGQTLWQAVFASVNSLDTFGVEAGRPASLADLHMG